MKWAIPTSGHSCLPVFPHKLRSHIHCNVFATDWLATKKQLQPPCHQDRQMGIWRSPHDQSPIGGLAGDNCSQILVTSRRDWLPNGWRLIGDWLHSWETSKQWWPNKVLGLAGDYLAMVENWLIVGLVIFQNMFVLGYKYQDHVTGDQLQGFSVTTGTMGDMLPTSSRRRPKTFLRSFFLQRNFKCSPCNDIQPVWDPTASSLLPPSPTPPPPAPAPAPAPHHHPPHCPCKFFPSLMCSKCWNKLFIHLTFN